MHIYCANGKLSFPLGTYDLELGNAANDVHVRVLLYVRHSHTGERQGSELIDFQQDHRSPTRRKGKWGFSFFIGEP